MNKNDNIMSTLQRLENISYDDIENKLMLILLANPNRTYTKSELYNILLENLESNTQYVHPQFKFKYMVVLNQLPSNHDVKVTDELVTSGLDIDYSELKNKENDKLITINYAVCNNDCKDISFYHCHAYNGVLSTLNKDFIINVIIIQK